ncbi:imm11 family protein [Caldalkalibacillus mannanilyticus]|uniref:imm11 family protein n=1 Tax=Caldalkalibacillus mannanilyticus TaxID=1418 RepID=UPI00046ACCF1|nr:DUF1629 domain-containing protein [Caldalkalibacillus mannanilyticus]
MYLLEISEEYPNNYWLEYDHEKFPDHLIFKSGSEVDVSSFQEIYLRANKKVSLERLSSYDYLFSSGPDLISNKLADIFIRRNLANQIQTIPVTILCGDMEVKGFNIIIYKKCDTAIDMKASTYVPLLKYMPDGPKKFTSVVILEKEPHYKIFRAEENKDKVIVSHDLKVELEREGVKGIKFVKEKRCF